MYLETVKLLKEKKGKFPDIGLHNDFYGYDTPKCKQIKQKISWEYIKPRNFLYNKRNSQQNEKAIYQMEQQIAANYIPDKRLISKIYKVLT